MIDFPIIDSHIHLLDQNRFGYSWASGAPALKRDWTPDDLANSRSRIEIEGFVFVEVDVDMPQYLDEAEWVDGLASHDRRVLGAVVCLPLERGAGIEPEMARAAKLKTVRGVRRLIQNQADPDFVLKPGLYRGHPTLAEVQPLVRRLHLPCPGAQHAGDDAAVSRGFLHPRSHRQARNQGGPPRPMAGAYPRDGGAAQCRVQALRRHHRGRSKAGPAISSGPTSTT